MVELERFSFLAKLLRVVTYVFQFVFSLKKVSLHPNLAALLYLLKVEQSLCLTKEKLFPLNPSSSEVPFLIASLNLFLDEEELIRFRGKIGKSEFHSQNVLFPILLPRFSRLTELIFMDCHIKCKHLGIAATLCKLRLSGFFFFLAHKAKELKQSYILVDCVSIMPFPSSTPR